MSSVFIQLNISADALLAWYRGEAKLVSAKTECGRTIQFPASALQRFVSPNGIQGRFQFYFNSQHKITRVERVTGTLSPRSGGGWIV